ncbi:oligosaccharide flippase family protein [Cobetia sp. D5]|uniref:oligosaccharide flippase family protein n=1 Tax=Cobetia sp. D5 TaxID=3105867 RepID=UPI002D77DDEF|nr:oligosaccharide flippase family protein [Cobetia sp. D5]
MNNALWSSAAQLFNRGGLVVASILLSTRLNTDSFAAYSYFYLTVSMIATYAALGMGVTASKFFAESSISEDKPPIGSLWLLSIVFGVIVSIVLLTIPNSWVDGELDTPSWLYAVGVLIITLGIIPNGGILGLEKYAQATFVSALSTIVLLVGTLLFSTSGNSSHAIYIYIAANLIQTIGTVIIVTKTLGITYLKDTIIFTSESFNKILMFTGPMIGVSILSASGPWIMGRIMLTQPMGNENFSLYAIGMQWFSLALFLPGMVSRVLLPRLIRSGFEYNNVDESKKTVRYACLITMLLATVTACICSILSPWLLSMYGDIYTGKSWVIIGFLFSAACLAPANTLGNAIISKNGQLKWLIITSTWFIILIVSYATTIGLGIKGSIISLFIAALTMSTLSYFIAKRMNLV